MKRNFPSITFSRAYETRFLLARDESSVMVSLRPEFSRGEHFFEPQFQVQGAAMACSVDRAMYLHNARTALLEAVFWVKAKIGCNRYYNDGDCPCASCGGTGGTHEDVCKVCDGKGVR